MDPRIVIGLMLLVTLTTAATATAQEEDPRGAESRRLVEEVTVEEVKRFLDPTIMISDLDYDFQMNYLPGDTKLMVHRIGLDFALSNRQAIWFRIPILDYDIPGQGGPSGLGDILGAYGFIFHEDHTSRLTSVAGIVEVQAPTGDAEQGLGIGKTFVAPGGLVALNPTDVFPIYLWFSYVHSIETGGTSPWPQVRHFKLNIQTIHILPKGFFLALVPDILVDLEGDFNVFSLGAGLGRALNRRILVQGAYVHRVAGEETFSQGFQVGLQWLWGSDMSAK